MNRTPLILEHPPELSDQAARQILDLLYDFVTAVENHYFSQLRQQPGSDLTSLQQDLFEDLQHHDETLRR